nr:peptidases S8 S53 super family [Sicyoidochytrium minutum DNA virus]
MIFVLNKYWLGVNSMKFVPKTRGLHPKSTTGHRHFQVVLKKKSDDKPYTVTEMNTIADEFEAVAGSDKMRACSWRIGKHFTTLMIDALSKNLVEQAEKDMNYIDFFVEIKGIQCDLSYRGVSDVFVANSGAPFQLCSVKETVLDATRIDVTLGDPQLQTNRGNGVDVLVFDSPVPKSSDFNVDEFTKRQGGAVKLLDPVPSVDPNGNNYHALAVMSALAGWKAGPAAAANLYFYPVKSDLLAFLEDALSNFEDSTRPLVVNWSGSIQFSAIFPSSYIDAANSILTSFLASKPNTLFFASAGNENFDICKNESLNIPGCPLCYLYPASTLGKDPATLPWRLVGATEITPTLQHRWAPYSNFGSCVKFNQDGSFPCAFDNYENSFGYNTVAGTSFSSPRVASIAASAYAKFPNLEGGLLLNKLDYNKITVSENPGSGTDARFVTLPESLLFGNDEAVFWKDSVPVWMIVVYSLAGLLVVGLIIEFTRRQIKGRKITVKKP